jgi:hypothetical protein
VFATHVAVATPVQQQRRRLDALERGADVGAHEYVVQRLEISGATGEPLTAPATAPPARRSRTASQDGRGSAPRRSFRSRRSVKIKRLNEASRCRWPATVGAGFAVTQRAHAVRPNSGHPRPIHPMSCRSGDERVRSGLQIDSVKRCILGFIDGGRTQGGRPPLRRRRVGA